MGWVIAGAILLAAMAVVFHLIQEYFWSVVFIISAGVLAAFILVLANMPSGSGP